MTQNDGGRIENDGGAGAVYPPAEAFKGDNSALIFQHYPVPHSPNVVGPRPIGLAYKAVEAGEV